MITQEDVARECGLSVTTVSRVMNKRGYISEETYRKVYDAMRRLNYSPNEIARSLSKNFTDTVGVILPHVDHPFFSRLLHYLEIAAGENGLKLMLFCTHKNAGGEEACIEKCRAARMDGIILCIDSDQPLAFSNLNIPLITVEGSSVCHTASISCDNLEGGRLAARILAEDGCRSVVYIGGSNENAMPADSRYKGFEEVCAGKHILCREVKTGREEYDSLEYREDIKRLLDRYPDIDGIFASSDVIAAQVLQVLAEKNISVPGKVRLIGFDDTMVSALTVPRITTISQPIRQMAEKAMDLLIRARRGDKIKQKDITLPVSLVRRDTA